MAEKVRYNKIIDLLERGKRVFSTSTVPNGNLDDLTYIADADYDAVIIEMEHEGFSLPSRPGEFHPEPLTDPDVTLSRHPARAIA